MSNVTLKCVLSMFRTCLRENVYLFPENLKAIQGLRIDYDGDLFGT